MRGEFSVGDMKVGETEFSGVIRDLDVKCTVVAGAKGYGFTASPRGKEAALGFGERHGGPDSFAVLLERELVGDFQAGVGEQVGSELGGHLLNDDQPLSVAADGGEQVTELADGFLLRLGVLRAASGRGSGEQAVGFFDEQKMLQL